MRPKDQGTRFETEIVNAAHDAGLRAWRLAEGGSHDIGDVAIETTDGDTYVVECKHRERLGVHQALGKTLAKADKEDGPFLVSGTALVWKRSVLREGNERRTSEGVVVCVSLGEWLELIGR